MLKIWEPIEDAPIDGYEILSRQDARLARDTASNLFDMLGYDDAGDAALILERAKAICRATGIPIGQHFRPVFVHSAGGIRTDYLLTDLACYLIIINADAGHPAVARAQVYFLKLNAR